MKKRKTKSSIARLSPRLALNLLMVAIAAVPAITPPLRAQQRAPQERIAEGSVVSKSDVPLAGAIVYLKDTKTNAVKTYIADKDGHFRFGELSQNTDYELWAENDGLHSRHKGISYISSKNDYNFTLKIDSQK
jgi:hypothetical protein